MSCAAVATLTRDRRSHFELEVFEPCPRSLDIFAVQIDGHPSTARCLSNASSGVAPSKWINDKVARIRQELNEEPRQLRRESRGMYFYSCSLARIRVLLVITGI